MIRTRRRILRRITTPEAEGHAVMRAPALTHADLCFRTLVIRELQHVVDPTGLPLCKDESRPFTERETSPRRPNAQYQRRVDELLIAGLIRKCIS